MSQQGPLLVVSSAGQPSFVRALDEARMFPVIETPLPAAARAVKQMQPSAVLADMHGVDRAPFAALAKLIAARTPYVPLIAIDPTAPLPDNAIPFTSHAAKFDRLPARLNAALRVRALHMTVLRRLSEEPATRLPDSDPAREATVLLIGRGGSYPALSVALGERLGVVGAFSIEAAANHLNTRDIDGIVLGEGFTARVADAFLTVLSEDARFRKLPIILTSDALAPSYELPNLEIIIGEPAEIAANALPLIRQHAFEARLGRTLRAIDAEGLLDPHTGLLVKASFDRDFVTAVQQTLANGGGLSVARFAFDAANTRAQLDGARIISRLMRQTDFGAVQTDGSVIVAFIDADLRNAHGIARRLSAVMRHTASGKRGARSEPTVTVATLQPQDSPKSLLARLYHPAQRAAS
ncbi:MAG TPA: GGDEF domain-containing protein [Bradyrhizobium sp.]|uniref:GGDEF domain-containing protein n=1 Tax=Bradyrhizobium sp. TaxID=376 RepID=UPI002B8DEE50|nr:GGDEF domain-containing protein [Bradyrhizobium sp.]HLZ01364.1 GGDEF domain-containing protein [Bradyrhizobium sp.]